MSLFVITLGLEGLARARMSVVTFAICGGLHWYTMRCIHPSQRCICSRQVTDNIFEIETTAMAHVACAPKESCILLTDVVAAYRSVNHAWILFVIEKIELPDCFSRFLRSLFNDSTTQVAFLGATRGQFPTARSVRQGCLASGFFFAMAFDTFFRSLQETVIPRIPRNLDLLQPVQCAYADDRAVAASSFLDLMAALAPSFFFSVDHIAGLNLNYRKCCWVRHGTEGRESLSHWISENCSEFREMLIDRHVKYVGP